MENTKVKEGVEDFRLQSSSQYLPWRSVFLLETTNVHSCTTFLAAADVKFKIKSAFLFEPFCHSGTVFDILGNTHFLAES